MCCLATARLTTNVLSCLSSICSYSYPSSHSDLLPTSCTSSYSICALSHCHLILHYQTCLRNLALSPRAYVSIFACTIRLAAYVFSNLLPRYSQTHFLCILRFAAYVSIHRLTAYLVSGSLPMYSQACCLSSLRLTAYVFSGLLPMYSRAHCLSSHRLTAYVFSGSLPMYSQVHCLCIFRLTAHVFLDSLPMYSQAHCLSVSGSHMHLHGTHSITPSRDQDMFLLTCVCCCLHQAHRLLLLIANANF